MSNDSPQNKTYDHPKLEFLKEFGTDLTLEASEGRLSPIVGRTDVVDMMIQTLCRSTKSNPVLTGPAGVGKTALVEGLALKVFNNDVPEKLRNCRIFSVSALSLIAGASWYGMIDHRVKSLLEEAKRKNVIVFIDEIHTLIDSGPGGDTSRDISQQMKPALSRGQIRLIGATTDEEYRKFIAKDRALERRFQPIPVPEVSSEETLTLLREISNRFSEKNGIIASENILRLVLSYSDRFIRNRRFPDKAIDLFEQSVAYAESRNMKVVSANDAKTVVQRMVGMPDNVDDVLNDLYDNFIGKGFLSEEQSAEFRNLLKISLYGLNLHPERPNATVLMLGAGSRASEYFAELLASTLFGFGDRLIKLDVSGITSKTEFDQMLGIEKMAFRQQDIDSPAAKIAHTPWCVIHCKGLDDCDHSVQEALARAIECGYITNSDNRKIYLSDSLFVLDADIDLSAKKLGFGSLKDEPVSALLPTQVGKLISSSLVNLADLVIQKSQDNEEASRRQWLKHTLHEKLTKRLRQQGIYVQWDKSFIEHLNCRLADFAYDHQWERILNIEVMPELLPFIEDFGTRTSLIVRFKDGTIVVNAEELSTNAEEALKFEESIKKDLSEKFTLWLKGLYYIEKDDDYSKVAIHVGTSKIEVYFSFWKERPLLSFLTLVQEKFDEPEDSHVGLLEKNMVLRFGKLARDVDGDTWLEYSAFGDHLDAGALVLILKTMFETCRKFKTDQPRVAKEMLSDKQSAWLEAHRAKA